MGERILIVDDKEIVIRSCLRILSDSGYQVEGVRDGHEAIRRIENNSYDLIILDIMMPKINGLEVLRCVKDTQPKINIIMITGKPDINTVAQARKLGACDYLSKPFEPEELKQMVQRALERQTATERG